MISECGAVDFDISSPHENCPIIRVSLLGSTPLPCPWIDPEPQGDDGPRRDGSAPAARTEPGRKRSHEIAPASDLQVIWSIEANAVIDDGDRPDRVTPTQHDRDQAEGPIWEGMLGRVGNKLVDDQAEVPAPLSGQHAANRIDPASNPATIEVGLA